MNVYMTTCDFLHWRSYHCAHVKRTPHEDKRNSAAVNASAAPMSTHSASGSARTEEVPWVCPWVHPSAVVCNQILVAGCCRFLVRHELLVSAARVLVSLHQILFLTPSFWRAHIFSPRNLPRRQVGSPETSGNPHRVHARRQAQNPPSHQMAY